MSSIFDALKKLEGEKSADRGGGLKKDLFRPPPRGGRGKRFRSGLIAVAVVVLGGGAALLWSRSRTEPPVQPEAAPDRPASVGVMSASREETRTAGAERGVSAADRLTREQLLTRYRALRERREGRAGAGEAPTGAPRPVQPPEGPVNPPIVALPIHEKPAGGYPLAPSAEPRRIARAPGVSPPEAPAPTTAAAPEKPPAPASAPAAPGAGSQKEPPKPEAASAPAAPEGGAPAEKPPAPKAAAASAPAAPLAGSQKEPPKPEAASASAAPEGGAPAEKPPAPKAAAASAPAAPLAGSQKEPPEPEAASAPAARAQQRVAQMKAGLPSATPEVPAAHPATAAPEVGAPNAPPPSPVVESAGPTVTLTEVTYNPRRDRRSAYLRVGDAAPRRALEGETLDGIEVREILPGAVIVVVAGRAVTLDVGESLSLTVTRSDFH
jgi:hypothetical protein